MKTPIQYEHELAALAAKKADQLDAAGKANLLEQLTKLEGQLVMDIRSLSAQFRARALSQVGSTTIKAGKDKATAGKRLQDEQHSRLDPYQKILEQIKEMMAEEK